MIKRVILSLVCGGFLLFTASTAMAFGIGAYATVGGGGSTFKTTKKDYMPNITDTSSDLTAGAGLIFDTNLAYNSIFNYRFKFGGGKYWVDREKEIDMARLHLSNIFGFGLVRAKYVRWWLGPQMGATYSWGKRGERTYIGIAKESYGYQMLAYGAPSIFDWNIPGPFKDKIRKIDYGGINLGLATGVNINIGKNFTIALETGFKYNLNWGNQYRKIYTWPIGLYEINSFKEKLFVHGWELYGEVAFMFRLSSDNYGGR
jgi:hypothetical protein